jgi:hypothetical protein
MAFKINKKIEVDIKKLAKMLPLSYQEIPLTRQVLGTALINNGVTKIEDNYGVGLDIVIEDGMPVFKPKYIEVNPNKTYVGSVKGKQAVNHFRRMKQIYIDKGAEGVREYANKFKQN